MLKKVGSGLLIALLVVVLVGFFVVLPLGLLGAGAYRAVRHERMIRTAAPVEAQVLWSDVVVKRSRKSTSYKPVVQYRYEVNGQTYTGSNVSPLNDINSLSEADDIKRRHPVLARRPAFYLPADPATSFLIKRWSGDPYGMYYVGLGLIAVFMTCGAGFLFVKKPPTAVATDVKDGRWTRLSPSRTLRARVVVNVAQGLVVLALTGWAAWHYHARFGAKDARGTIAAIAFGLWGLLFFYFAWRANQIRRAVSDARVLVEADDLRPGRTARVRVLQEVSGDANLEEVKVGLVCTETVGQGKSAQTKKAWEHWHAESSPRPGAKGGSGSLLASRLGLGADSRQTMTIDTTIAIPSESRPTTPPNSDPAYVWKLHVVTAIANCPDYKQEFGVTVLAAE